MSRKNWKGRLRNAKNSQHMSSCKGYNMQKAKGHQFLGKRSRQPTSQGGVYRVGEEKIKEEDRCT